MSRLRLAWACLGLALSPSLACAAPQQPAAQQRAHPTDEHARARWTYEISVDAALEHMQLGVCIEGPRPQRLRAGEGAVAFVERAQVRGGPQLVRDDQTFLVDTLGSHGCVDFTIDLDAVTQSGARDCMRSGDSLLVAPDTWLWYPAKLPAQVDARARFELPEGIHATSPWAPGEDGWRTLEHSAFGWNAWIAVGRYEPLRFELGASTFEVAVLDGQRAASDAGIVAWLETAVATSAELFGEFPRAHTNFVVVPSPAWNDEPVLFGVARRGGGGSVMLLLNNQAQDAALPGEWVAAHELLHLGMPFVDAPWLSEGFVTYYTTVLRARQGVLTSGGPQRQTLRALAKLQAGFERGRGGARTLAYASDNMRRTGSYARVYWGGAAAAFDLDVSIRQASGNRHSLDDIMLELRDDAPVHRRHDQAEILAQMDALLARWKQAGELDGELIASELLARHLRAERIPQYVEFLERMAVEGQGADLRLAADPADAAALRESLFRARDAALP